MKKQRNKADIKRISVKPEAKVKTVKRSSAKSEYIETFNDKLISDYNAKIASKSEKLKLHKIDVRGSLANERKELLVNKKRNTFINQSNLKVTVIRDVMPNFYRSDVPESVNHSLPCIDLETSVKTSFNPISEAEQGNIVLSGLDTYKAKPQNKFNCIAPVIDAKRKKDNRRKDNIKTSERKFKRDVNNGFRLQKRNDTEQRFERERIESKRRDDLRKSYGKDLLTTSAKSEQAKICLDCLKIYKSVSRHTEICACRSLRLKAIEICVSCYASKQTFKTVSDGITRYSSKCKCRKSNR